MCPIYGYVGNSREGVLNGPLLIRGGWYYLLKWHILHTKMTRIRIYAGWPTKMTHIAHQNVLDWAMILLFGIQNWFLHLAFEEFHFQLSILRFVFKFGVLFWESRSDLEFGFGCFFGFFSPEILTWFEVLDLRFFFLLIVVLRLYLRLQSQNNNKKKEKLNLKSS